MGLHALRLGSKNLSRLDSGPELMPSIDPVSGRLIDEWESEMEEEVDEEEGSDDGSEGKSDTDFSSDVE